MEVIFEGYEFDYLLSFEYYLLFVINWFIKLGLVYNFNLMVIYYDIYVVLVLIIG